MKKFYAGIGSRETPHEILNEMTTLASMLEARGFTCRSGNAAGADQAFAYGIKSAAQIWLPWEGFQRDFQSKRPNHEYKIWIPRYDLEAAESILQFHPAALNLNMTSICFMGRNYRQVIGLNEPNSEFIVCWTREGKPSGGTAQAMRIANHHKIPIINMFDFTTAHAVLDRLHIWFEI